MRPALALQGVMVLFVFPTVRRRIKTYSEDQDAQESTEDTVRHRSPRSRGSRAEAYSSADSDHIGTWSFKLLRCEFYCRFDPVRRCELKARTTPGEIGGQSLPGSNRTFLCFGDLRRLSGMNRCAGGMPIPARARRRASFSILIPGFFLRMTVIPRESRLAASALVPTFGCPGSIVQRLDFRPKRRW
jgi:hypothetical protein